MSQEQLKAFLAKVKGDSNLQEKLKAAKSNDELVSISEDYGHEFTAEKIRTLSQRELESIAGGSCLGCDSWEDGPDCDVG
jgi:predicted ribosomally synthesized peptide with nif11-like leader